MRHFLVITALAGVLQCANAEEISSVLLERTISIGKVDFQLPGDAELKEAQVILGNYDSRFMKLRRYAFHCNVEMSSVDMNGAPSYLEYLHAVDVEKDLQRQVSVYHKVYDPELAALGTLKSGNQGFIDPAEDNPAIPIRRDRLKIVKKCYRGADDAGESIDSVPLSPDGYFNPFSAPLCSYNKLVKTNSIQDHPSRYLLIAQDILKGVSKRDSQYLIKLRLKPPPELPEHIASRYRHEVIVGFEAGIPVLCEIWFGFDDNVQIVSRTETRWSVFGNIQAPTSIDCYSIEKGNVNGVYHARLEWTFDNNVEPSLFEKSDIKQRFHMKLR